MNMLLLFFETQSNTSPANTCEVRPPYVLGAHVHTPHTGGEVRLAPPIGWYFIPYRQSQDADFVRF